RRFAGNGRQGAARAAGANRNPWLATAGGSAVSCRIVAHCPEGVLVIDAVSAHLRAGRGVSCAGTPGWSARTTAATAATAVRSRRHADGGALSGGAERIIGSHFETESS